MLSNAALSVLKFLTFGNGGSHTIWVKRLDSSSLVEQWDGLKATVGVYKKPKSVLILKYCF